MLVVLFEIVWWVLRILWVWGLVGFNGGLVVLCRGGLCVV